MTKNFILLTKYLKNNNNNKNESFPFIFFVLNCLCQMKIREKRGDP